MNNIYWEDRANVGVLYALKDRENKSLFPMKRLERIYKSLEEIKHTGNINIYLGNGRRFRLILSKGI